MLIEINMPRAMVLKKATPENPFYEITLSTEAPYFDATHLEELAALIATCDPGYPITLKCAEEGLPTQEECSAIIACLKKLSVPYEVRFEGGKSGRDQNNTNSLLRDFYFYAVRRAGIERALHSDTTRKPSQETQRKIRRSKQLLNKGARIHTQLQHQQHFHQAQGVQQVQETQQQVQQQQMQVRQAQLQQQSARMQAYGHESDRTDIAISQHLLHEHNLETFASKHAYKLEDVKRAGPNLM